MTFRRFLDEVLVPMFPGVEILAEPWQPQRKVSSLVTFASGANRLRVRESVVEPVFLQLSRAQPFASDEKDLVENLVRAFADVRSEAKAYLSQLQGAIIRKAIAKSVAPGRPSQQRMITTILETMSSWATQTYEGERVSSGCIVTTSHFAASERLDVGQLLREDFAKNLTDGVDSWWRIAAVGGIRCFETSEDETILTAPANGFFPLRYRPLALRTAEKAVGIALNRNGEILVFAQKELRFAMRRGGWVNFAHDSIVTQMSPGGGGSMSLRRAIYASSLDVSFARSGGCIGLLRTRDLPSFRAANVVSPDDRIDTVGSSVKSIAAAALISGRSFEILPRTIRKELLGLDGAVVLGPNGSVYAAGAILKLGAVNLGNQGGRSAAAKTLSNYGLGIKVSEDGMISGYKKELGNVEAAFKVG